MEGDREHIRLEMESRSSNEEFARVVAAVFMSRLDPTLEEMDDVKTAVSEAVTNAVIHGYREKCGTVVMELTADRTERSLTVEVTDQGTGIEDIKRPWNPCIPQTDQERGLEWALLLWKPLWMRSQWNQRPDAEQRSP